MWKPPKLWLLTKMIELKLLMCNAITTLVQKRVLLIVSGWYGWKTMLVMGERGAQLVKMGS